MVKYFLANTRHVSFPWLKFPDTTAISIRQYFIWKKCNVLQVWESPFECIPLYQ
jgi:hypothetical protein